MSGTLNLILLFVLSFGLALALGRPLIAALGRASLRQRAYEDAPKTHAVKTGTPTMGGLLFIVALVLALVWRPDGETAALVLLGAACGLIGFIDDFISVQRGRNRGMRGRIKFLATAIVGVAFLAVARPIVPADLQGVIFSAGAFSLHVPIWLWYVLGVCAIVATTNAVNLTDGLDGLAAGSILFPLAVFVWLALRGGNAAVAVTGVALGGALLGFLVYNRYPAKLIMGDTGSLALGGILAGSAILTGEQLLLVLVGGVFVAEALSVILQVASYKTTRKRIFRMSPLHHHFELGGWPETRVTSTFWTASALCSIAGAVLTR